VNPVTILMPVRDHHPLFLRRSLDSVAGQTSDAWRLLVIVEPDDRPYFERLLDRDLGHPAIRLVTNAGRRLAGALNTGMDEATTAFVAILLADDMWAPEAVQILTRDIARHPDVDFFHSARQIVNERDEPISSVYRSREQFTLDDFAWFGPVKHLLCWRRQAGLDCGGMDESFVVGPDDYDFPWTMAEHGARFRAIRECLYYYRDHRECPRITTHLPLDRHKEEIARMLRKHGVERQTRAARLRASERSYLRQCLFASPADEREKSRSGFDARTGWREIYR
jgi:glycosyltransferase involved in cell wall biosynthesis